MGCARSARGVEAMCGNPPVRFERIVRRRDTKAGVPGDGSRFSNRGSRPHVLVQTVNSRRIPSIETLKMRATALGRLEPIHEGAAWTTWNVRRRYGPGKAPPARANTSCAGGRTSSGERKRISSWVTSSRRGMPPELRLRSWLAKMHRNGLGGSWRSRKRRYPLSSLGARTPGLKRGTSNDTLRCQVAHCSGRFGGS